MFTVIACQTTIQLKCLLGIFTETMKSLNRACKKCYLDDTVADKWDSPLVDVKSYKIIYIILVLY